MSTQRKDGGSAYPIYTPDMNVGDDAGPGLSKLDWFAGQALVGMLASDMNLPVEEFASLAYRLGLAMLAQSRAHCEEGAAS